MHRVLKVALQPWPTLAGAGALVGYVTKYRVGSTYFRADQFCRRYHDDPEVKKRL